MPNIRRGLPPGVAPAAIRLAAAANAGLMASSSGKVSRIPAPRRNFRRDSAGRVEKKGAFIGCSLYRSSIDGAPPISLEKIRPLPARAARRPGLGAAYECKARRAVEGISLLVSEQFALHHFVDEAADTVVAGTGAFQDFLDRFAVREADRCAGRINRQLLREVAGELLFVGQQALFQFAHGAEFPAVGEFAVGVHGQRVVEGEFLSALGDALRQFAA